jgi:hypothetical protein
MLKKLGSLNIGDKVKFGSIFGNKITWLVADHGNYPNSTTLLTEKIIKIMAFDGAEAKNSNSERRESGNGNYSQSNILQWLNKDTSPWYVAQHNADAPPTKANCNNKSGYDDIPGFLYCWTADEKAVLLDTTVVSLKSYIDGNDYENVTSKMFLLSRMEIGVIWSGYEGTRLSIFKDYVAPCKITDDAYSNYEYDDIDAENWKWWTRSTYYSIPCANRIAYCNIDHTHYVYEGCFGLRPACNLALTQPISDTPDADGCYTLIFNQPPSIPASITVSGTIAVNQRPVITWGTSTDPEGTAVKYILERSFNSGAWNAVYNGPNKTFTESAIPAGNTTVKYRVKAYDAEGIESDYITSGLKSITQNTPPSITGSNTNLGTFANQKPAAYNYTVTDAEGGAVTVTEVLDNVTIRTYTPTLGVQQQFAFSDSDWLTVLNGTHTIKITAKDAQAAETTRSLTFTKNVTAIEFTAPIMAFQADGKPTQALINAVASLPAGCVFQAWICNNGHDASPAWEDCTQSVLTGQKHYFENAAKTADNWGVKVKARLERGSAVGAVSITSITGNFR